MDTDESSALPVESFAITHAPEAVDDLRRRLRATRWPDRSPAPAWQQGTDLDYLVDLVGYWADGFDWAEQQRWLNGFPHYHARVEGTTIHFVHVRAENGNGIPLVLSHGWPSCFVEYLPIIPLLTDPAAHGLDGPAFDVVVPSLPGYAYSDRPEQPAFTARDTARLWHRLMLRLGYPRYGAHGTDFGSAVTTFLALDQHASVLGIHLSNLDLFPHTGAGTPPLSRAEQAYLAQYQRWADEDRGYGVIQSTRPQTVGYGLTDSPAGLAAWVLEKWRAWSDCGGDLESRFSRDFLLTIVSLYWFTGTITSSMRDYVDNRHVSDLLGPTDRVRVPTAMAVFAHQFLDDGEPPREWAERLYDVHRWTTMPSGGHFAAAEEPGLLARDLGAFFAGL